MRTIIVAAAMLAGLVSQAQAGTIALPSSFLVDATGATGYTVTLDTVSTSDILSFTASGQSTLQYNPTQGNIYGTNAAGVITLAGSSNVGESSTDPDSHFTFGSLIVTLDGTNAQQAFATDAANGAGSMMPPTNLSFSESLGTLFGLADGQQLTNVTLNFHVDDNYYPDNTGGYTIASANGSVPEPATWAMMMTGFGLAGVTFRTRRGASEQAV